ncbi:MAG: tyrosine-type recombinase/integrase [Limisphaerales bacterium]
MYRRKTPSGNFGYMVSNYADGDRRRFDSYANESDALEAADKLARRIDSRDYVAASMTREQAIEFANASARLKPFNVTVDAATATVAECLKTVGDLSTLHAAVKFYRQRHRKVTNKRVAEVTTELLQIKKARGASARYWKDLDCRLGAFAKSFQVDIGNVTTAQIQAWLDGLNLSAQSVTNFRRVLNLLFSFAIARGYAVDNPVAGVEKVKVNGGEIEIFTPAEIQRLLAAASPAFLPCLALGAFAGLRSAEIERLEWSDIHLAEKFIVVGASKAKTASRRVVPVSDNLAAWLAPYFEMTGKVWTGGWLYKAQRDCADATEVKADAKKNIPVQKPVKWKANGLRHSFASYRFAQTGDAGRVAGELGNSAAVVFRHYRELVRPADAVKWFAVAPEQAANVVTLAAVANK